MLLKPTCRWGRFNGHQDRSVHSHHQRLLRHHLQVVLQNYNHSKATITSSPIYSASARVRPGEATDMYLNRNGEVIEESRWLTMMASDGAAAYIDDQGSRTVVGSILLKSGPGLSSDSLTFTSELRLN